MEWSKNWWDKKFLAGHFMGLGQNNKKGEFINEQ